MRKNLTISLVLASAIALTTLAVSAQTGDGPQGDWHGGHEHGHGQFMAMSKLNLTDAQRASVKQIMHTSFAQNKTQHQTLHQQRDAFEAMTPDQVGYQAAAASLAQAEASATQQRVVQQAAVRTQVWAILTTQQKAQYATLKTQQETRKAKWEQFKSQNPSPATDAVPEAQ